MDRESGSTMMEIKPEMTQTRLPKQTSPEDGRFVVGRHFVNRDTLFESIDVNELLFLMKTLNSQDIRDMI